MNEALERRWRDGTVPFDCQAVSFASGDLTPPPALRLALLDVLSRLRQRWPEVALLILSHGDTYVRWAFFPPACDFYLRVYVPAEHDNNYPDRRGDFDVACAGELAAELADLAASASGLLIAECSAKDFFDRRSGA